MTRDLEQEARILDSLEFDPDLPCMAATWLECSHPARWYIRCRGCDTYIVRCDGHLQQLLRLARMSQFASKCPKCGFEAQSFTDLYAVSPIRVRTS